MSTHDGKRVASPVSNQSVFSAESIRSGATTRPSVSTTAHRKVVTAPPWARHEPPSPEASTSNFLGVESTIPVPANGTAASDSTRRQYNNNSEVASSHASTAEPSHWWTFNLPLPLTLPLRKNSTNVPTTPVDPPKDEQTMRERPRANWFFDRAQVRGVESSDDEAQAQAQDSQRRGLKLTRTSSGERGGRLKTLRLHLPTPGAQFTTAQTRTPGWETPWAPFPRRPEAAHTRSGDIPDSNHHYEEMENGYDDPDDSKSRRGKRRRTIRWFLLHGNYVPLIIRALNVTFTAATLAVAITIRRLEMENNLVGAVGSSVILAIIFSPLTLIHVMIAIYLEYFGRPLGLWRTSGKLTHTLLEMLFICMWSSSLSLSFDNYFTSSLQCAPPSASSWWNKLPPTPALPDIRDGVSPVATEICRDQITLICLVFFGLILYCSNLIVSLFRIFEKVKSHGETFTRRV